MAPYVPETRLTAAENERITKSTTELRELQRQRDERIKRCAEDPVFAAKWQAEQDEKMKKNKGLFGSRWALASDPPRVFKYVPAPILPGFKRALPPVLPTIHEAPVISDAQEIAKVTDLPTATSPTTSSCSSRSSKLRPEAPFFVASSSIEGNISAPASLSSSQGGSAHIPRKRLGGLENSKWATPDTSISAVSASGSWVRPCMPAFKDPNRVLFKSRPCVGGGLDTVDVWAPDFTCGGALREINEYIAGRDKERAEERARALLMMEGHPTKSVVPSLRTVSCPAPAASAWVPPHLRVHGSQAVPPDVKEATTAPPSASLSPECISPVNKSTSQVKFVDENTKYEAKKKSIETINGKMDEKTGSAKSLSGTSNWVPPHLQSTSSTSQSQTSSSSNLAVTAPPVSATPIPIPSNVVHQTALRDFQKSNMRNGINIRKCSAMDFYRHGANAPEHEPEPSASNPSVPYSIPSDNSSSIYGNLAAQVAPRIAPQARPSASALKIDQDDMPAATAALDNVTSGTKQSTGITSPIASAAKQLAPHQMTSSQYEQWSTNEARRKASLNPTKLTLDTTGESEGEGVKNVTEQPFLQIPASGIAQGISESNMEINQVPAVSNASSGDLTDAELLFLQTYVKSTKLPHQMTADESKERREYERLGKLQALSKVNDASGSIHKPHRAPGVVSTDEFMASCQGPSAITGKYGRPKKDASPPISRNSTSPLTKIRRPPFSINPFSNPAWNLSNVDPSAFMAHVNARAPDGKGKTYSGKAINQPESEDLMSTRRPGTQVWIDTVEMGGKTNTSPTLILKQENVQPVLKESSSPQREAEKMALNVAESTDAPSEVGLLPHLRGSVSALKQICSSQMIVEIKSVVNSDSKEAHSADPLLPHLRASISALKQNASSHTTLENKSLVASDSKNGSLTSALPPHLRGGVNAQIVPPQNPAEKNSLHIPADIPVNQSAYVPPHLRFSMINSLIQKQKSHSQDAVGKIPLSASGNVKDTSRPAYLPPHLNQVVGASKQPAAVNQFVPDAKTKDIKIQTPSIPLTADSLVKATGDIPCDHSESNDFHVSDEGFAPNPKENIRATQGNDPAEQLLDFDGRWNPPPCNWDDRTGHDNSYVSDYIREWSATLPVLTKAIDTSQPGFRTGEFVFVGECLLGPAPLHGETFPTVEPENHVQRTTQTSESEVQLYIKGLMAKRAKAQSISRVTAQHYKELSMRPVEPDPFSPTIDMYLRPATTKDLAGIVKIYNHYVNHSIIPEDQDDVTEQDINFLLQGCKLNRLPFLVAVRGKCPAITDAQGRQLKKVATPQHENVIGIAFAQVQAFGFGAATTYNGRSRTNANLHLYVHHEFQKRGVGRNLLDRLLVSMNPTYSFRNCAYWINPDNDPRFIKEKFPDRWHRLFFHVPVEKKEDAAFLRAKEILAKFYFWDDEETRQTSAVRTSKKNGLARFADLAIFSRVCLQADCFPGFL